MEARHFPNLLKPSLFDVQNPRIKKIRNIALQLLKILPGLLADNDLEDH